MEHLSRKITIVLTLLASALWSGSVLADNFCADLTKIVSQSGEFAGLKGEPVEGERFKAKSQVSGFKQCTIAPFRSSFSYTCETAPELSQPSAEKKWKDFNVKIADCFKGNWRMREAGKQNIFFADRKKGESMALSVREVAGFRREGNQLKTFPTYYNRLTVFPRKKMSKKSN